MSPGAPAPPAVLVLDDARHVALTGAELVANRVRARTHMRLLLPTGRTPRQLYAALRGHVADGSLATGHVTVLGLDEYVGLRREDPRSLRAALDAELAGVALARREALDGAAGDWQAEVARYQALLDTAPVDLAVLGLGRDAHVAFEEPGADPGDGVRRVALAPSTIDAAAEAFGGAEHVPREALTVGLRTLLAAREVLLLVTGEAKAQALRAALEGPVGPAAPASLLRGHPCLTVLCDRAAAARLRPVPGATAATSRSCSATASRASAPSTGSRRTRACACTGRRGWRTGRRCARCCSPASRIRAGSPRPSRWRASGRGRTCPRCSTWPGATRPRTPPARCRSCSRSAS